MQQSSTASWLATVPQPILLSYAGLMTITVLVISTIGLRSLFGSTPDEPTSHAKPVVSVSSKASGEPDARPRSTSTADASEASNATPLMRREARAIVDKDLQMGRYRDFVTHLDELLKIDPTAATDSDLRYQIVDKVLMRIMRDKGDHVDKMFEILRTQMGTTGIDILFELMTTRGGSMASKRATDLLRDESVRQRGSAALQIAYDLRVASCDEKRKLLERAKTDGDNRTLGQLHLLNNECGRRNRGCCMHKDPELVAAIDGIKARYPQLR